ncbi:M43 family zinc metalloprotease [Flavobacterium davisii]|uniref:T9SS type A sorting domain-containing protein n=1 Tax=Flavobacterium columnare TaxID=996 RepID=A0A8G0KTM0_9FLAO|nr:M43 family zinc metalloprotease [Flavobacterium davisii]QYS89901.1 T9SS type A sorting domain-containing protein [Flavobacterium davisii]
MKINYIIASLFVFLISFVSKGQNNQEGKVVRCSTVEYEKYLQKNNPKRANLVQFEKWLNPLIEKQKNNRSTFNGIITIPVVVHIVHSGQNVGQAPNIDDKQVISQIEVLNNDFRKKLNTPGYNTHPNGADLQIQFALAQVDPSGNPTNGIDRVYYNHAKWTENTEKKLGDIDLILKPETVWDSSLYLNIWVVDFVNAQLLGQAQFPSNANVPGSYEMGTEATDGIAVNYLNFGSVEIYPNGIYGSSRYDKGRTTTHEIGHWLGLRHIWGDLECGDDFCADTPQAHTSNTGCPLILSCTGTENEMVQNYMDYTDDNCMNIFTQNQKDRIQTVLANSPRRKTIVNSDKENPVLLLVNDAEIKIEKQYTGFTNLCVNEPRKFSIINQGINDINSVLVKYHFNNQATKDINWKGILKPNQYALMSIPEIGNENDILNVEIVAVNGVNDTRSTNNFAKVKIINTAQPEVFFYDEVKFDLQLDNKGEDITWELLNNSGKIIRSGGPYNNNDPISIQETWNLNDKECYTFNIKDEKGDGLCCDNGEGYYQIGYKDNIIIREGKFSKSSTKGFSVKYLENQIILEPNPVGDELNYLFGSKIGREGIGKIFDLTGKLIKEFKVEKNIVKPEAVSHLSSGLYLFQIVTETNSDAVIFIKK